MSEAASHWDAYNRRLAFEEIERLMALLAEKDAAALESLKARAEQWEKIAREYRTHREHQFCKIRVAGLMHGSTIDDRCDQCRAYDALSGPREGEQR